MAIEGPLWATWLEVLAFDLGRYVVFAGAAFLFFWVWKREQFIPRRIQKKFPKAARLHFELRYSMLTALIFSFVGLGVRLGIDAGVFNVYANISDYGWGYFALSVAVLILFQDAYFYWTHRAMHHPKLFRWTHAVHHRSSNPSPWASYSFAPAEALTHAAVVPLALVFMPAHQIALALFLTYMIVRNVLGHLGIELMPKSFTRNAVGEWHTTTTHHDMHHRNTRSNFGLYFTFWDRLMGTTNPGYEAEFDRVTVPRLLGDAPELTRRGRRSSSTSPCAAGLSHR